MIELTQKETLTRALNYLLNLYDEFIAEIESKTRDILVHTSCKILLNDTYRQSADPKMFKKSLQEWRKTSFHLHQRRSELKAVKDRLFCQISDLKTAIDDMDTPAFPRIVATVPIFPGVSSLRTTNMLAAGGPSTL